MKYTLIVLVSYVAFIFVARGIARFVLRHTKSEKAYYALSFTLIIVLLLLLTLRPT